MSTPTKKIQNNAQCNVKISNACLPKPNMRFLSYDKNNDTNLLKYS